jgi:hypothetical protein
VRRKLAAVNLAAGCEECCQGDAIWTNSNARRQALQHQNKTGHEVWISTHKIERIQRQRAAEGEATK